MAKKGFGLLSLGRWAGSIVGIVLGSIDAADPEAARRRVEDVRRRRPKWDAGQLVAELIKRKERQTALIGAATSGSAFIPGIGTIAAWTVGMVADIGATIRLQADLVLEIAEVHGRRLEPHERRRVVALVMGLSAAESELVAAGMRRATVLLSERFAEHWLLRAIPFVGVAASASANALATRLIGRRAEAYFSLGPEAMSDPRASLRAITGLDLRRPQRWLNRGKKQPPQSTAFLGQEE